MKFSFAPVTGSQTRVLILGSLPGELSLERGQYYANPRNQFWRLVGHTISIDLAESTYDQRLEALLAHGIGLWDVVGSAERVGSLDADIRNHTPNALVALVSGLPNIRALAFNGGTAFAVGRRQFQEVAEPRLIALPSSSPAHTMPFERKAAAWRQLSSYL